MFYENTGEFTVSADLSDHRLIDDLHHLYTGWGGHRYADVCVLHAADEGLFERIRSAELEYFGARRDGRPPS